MRYSMCILALALPSLIRAEDPPIKMGLWEATVTTNEDGTPKTEMEKHCITKQSWQQDMDKLSHPNDGCKIDVQKTSSGYTFKGDCGKAGSLMKVDGTMTFTDSEHTVLDAHTEMTANGQKLDIKKHVVSHFVGAACGNVRPGDN